MVELGANKGRYLEKDKIIDSGSFHHIKDRPSVPDILCRVVLKH
jgi:hypothetical protein